MVFFGVFGVLQAWPPVELVCMGHGGKGTPPQVWGVSWNPFGANPNTKTLGMGEFVTYGVKHIKLWRLCRGASVLLIARLVTQRQFFDNKNRSISLAKH